MGKTGGKEEVEKNGKVGGTERELEREGVGIEEKMKAGRQGRDGDKKDIRKDGKND